MPIKTHFSPGPEKSSVRQPKNSSSTISYPPFCTAKPLGRCTRKNAVSISKDNNKAASLVNNPNKIARPPNVSAKVTIHAANKGKGTRKNSMLQAEYFLRYFSNIFQTSPLIQPDPSPAALHPENLDTVQEAGHL